MNRRLFLKTSIPTGVMVAGAPSLLTMEGCDSATLKSYLNTVLDAAEKILALSRFLKLIWLMSIVKGFIGLAHKIGTDSTLSGRLSEIKR